MITNKGNQVLAKYLLGQSPEYAGYISIGVGAQPLITGEADSSSPTKMSMDFEAFRVPIESKGIVNDRVTAYISQISVVSNVATATTTVRHGISVGSTVDMTCATNSNFTGSFVVTAVSSNTFTFNKTMSNTSVSASPYVATAVYDRDRLVFKAQLPPDQRYQMTEIAVYPSGTNQLALGFDSRVLRSFLPNESWSLFDGANTTIPTITDTICDSFGNVNTSVVVSDAQFVNSDNAIFTYSGRTSKQETPRLFNRALMVKGNITSFTNDSMAISGTQKYLICQDIGLNLSKNSPDDVIKFAFSVIPTTINAASPTKTRLRFELKDSSGNTAYITALYLKATLDISRYQVLSKKINEFTISTSTFNWANIVSIHIYAQTLNSSNSYDNSWILFDGMRIDNENTENPLYGMVCYSRLYNSASSGLPIVKIENSQGYVEYRMGVSIF